MTDYPKVVRCGDAEVTLSLVAAGDGPDLKAFAESVPEHDLLFLTRDIKHPKVVEAWIAASADGSVKSLIARRDGEIVGMSAIVRDRQGWSPHVADLRLVIGAQMRGKGLGRVLLAECVDVAVADGAAKLTARMTPDQTSAIALFEENGFRGEALLRDHVRDRDGNLHDLAVYALHFGDAARRKALYGFVD